jgi:SPW repeat
MSETPTAQSIDGLTLLAGVFLAISPWVVGFGANAPGLAVNNLVCGITVAVLGLGYATMYGRTHGLSWVPVPLGIWVIVAPWLIYDTHVTTGIATVNVVIGVVIALLGFLTVAMASRRRVPGGAEHRAPRERRP